MDDQVLDEVYQDEESKEDGSSDVESETTEESEEAEEQPKKKENPMKALRKELKETKKALQEKNSWTLSNDSELRLFSLEHPEAKDYTEGIKAALEEFPWITMERALRLAKADAPKVSESKKDFDFKSKSKPADMMSMDDDEAAEKLSPSDYLKYSRAKWSGFVKADLRKKI